MEEAAQEASTMRGLIERGYSSTYQDASELIERSRSDQERSLDMETKRRLGQIWETQVLGRSDEPLDTSEQSPEELQQWMYDSLMTEVDAMVDEWGIDRHADILEQLRSSEGSERVAIERTYLQAVAEEISKLKGRLSPGDGHWDSWPANMRANRRMNCVGSTLLVQSLLRQAGIKHYAANPTHHSTTVAELTDGEMWYFDPLNGPTQVRKIEPTMREMNGSRVLEINDPVINYHYVPIRHPRAIVANIVGNLGALQHEGTIAYQPGVEYAEQARNYVDAHLPQLKDFPLDGLDETLDPERRRLRQHPDMQREEKRIQVLHDDRYEGEAQKFLRTLSPERALELLHEVRDSKDRFAAAIRGDQQALAQASPELQQYVTHVRHGQELMTAEHPEYADEHLTSILAWLAALETKKL